MLLRVLDVRKEAKRFISASNLNELKRNGKIHLRFKGFIQLKPSFVVGALPLLI